MNHETSLSSPPRIRGSALILLAAVAAFIFFFKLGARGFENKDTVWYVEIAWEMLRSGDWIVPRFNTVIFTEKPILFIWLVSIATRLTGALTPFTARLPSALSAMGCTFLTCSLGKRLFGARAGLLSGFILCTSYAFAWEARTCMVDILFTFFVTLSLSLFYTGLRDAGGGKSRFLLAYLAVALAALTKGPLGIILPAMVIFCYLLYRRGLRSLRAMLIPWGIVLILAVQAAWYVPFLLRIGPEGRSFFYEMYVYKENLLRFASGFDHYEPFWFYIPALFSRFLPWSPFLVLYALMPRARLAAGPPRDRAYPAIWFLSIFVFLTISSGKHSRYALPLYPAAALLVADFWDGLMDNRNWRSAFITIIIAFAAGWSCYIISLPTREARRAEDQRLAGELLPAVYDAPFATYGLFSRRLALGFFMGKPVIYIDQESKLLDYLRSEAEVFCLLETADYERLKGQLPPPAIPSGHYRYRDNDLILIKNK
ncbi:MAG: glycosyltransferase family 39 protein [Candidatus Aureabacteria bacterium]|nr:glycosyltransferase family 39 protein [Candidatus Auribacterota bacterium]